MPTLAIHAHFYQPDRRDPTTGAIPDEWSAAPAPNWNERIMTECYRPNALAGNYERVGADFGPTLLLWLREAHPDVHASIALAAAPTSPPDDDPDYAARSGRGVMAQSFHHSILPLATGRDRRTEIRWGLADFSFRFGRAPEGFWAPECAIDTATLVDLAEMGLRYVILAPWQAAEPVDTRRPYRIELGGGRRITVVFYDGPLSGRVSFDDELTVNADRFVTDYLAAAGGPLDDGSDPLVVIATDGELYGHHKPFRDHFLRALPAAAARHGWTMRTLGDVIAEIDPASLREVRIADRTSWSCHHGVKRWGEKVTGPAGEWLAGPGCDCTPDSGWKPTLRVAFDRLAWELDNAIEAYLNLYGVDFYATRDRYAPVAAGFADPDDFARAALSGTEHAEDPAAAEAVRDLMAAARARLAMYTSCAFFWDDPSRLETMNCLRYAAFAIETVRRYTDTDAEAEFLAALAPVTSTATGETGPALYRRAIAESDAALGSAVR